MLIYQRLCLINEFKTNLIFLRKKKKYNSCLNDNISKGFIFCFKKFRNFIENMTFEIISINNIVEI